jgi:DNA-binding SARP family transcriptional activator
MVEPYLHLLGGFEFVGTGPSVPLSRKARALMAYLALQAGHWQSREKLAAILWGIASDRQARMSLRQALSAIRKAMQSIGEGRLLTDGANIALRLEDLDFDVSQFELRAKGSSVEHLEEALALYRGDLLDGFALTEESFEDWLRLERERLRTLAIAAMEKLVAIYEASGDSASCIRTGARLLVMEPLREDVHLSLMRAYAAQGRVNLALRQYELCRDEI